MMNNEQAGASDAQAKICIECRNWRPHLERPWLKPSLTDIGSCTKQVDRYRNSSSWKTTGATHDCDCNEFTPNPESVNVEG